MTTDIMSWYAVTDAEPECQGHVRVSTLFLDGAPIGPEADLLILSMANYQPAPSGQAETG